MPNGNPQAEQPPRAAEGASGERARAGISRESEELLRLVIGGVRDFAIFAADTEGRILSWNPGVAHLFGYQEAEWIGQHGSVIFTPEDRERGEVGREMEAAARDGRAVDERWHVRKDGSRFWASGLLMRLGDGDGSVRGFAKMVRDATQRKLTEERLSQYAAIIRHSADAILAVTFDEIITLWNEGAEKMYGYTEAEAVGRPVTMIIPPERRREVSEILDRIRRGGSVERLETVRVRKDGSRLDVSVTVSPIRDAEGRVVGASTNARDITEHKRAEQERQRLLEEAQAAREEAERVNRQKDEFLATLSHELRTPLTVILGWSRLLRAGGLEEKMAARALETIERNAVAQKQLIDDILDVSRIIMGKLTLEEQAVELAPLIEDAVHSVRPAAEAARVELRTAAAAGPCRVTGDPARLQQVVWNLLSSAVKFTPEGGSVEVRLECAGPSARVVVRDTGGGIEPEFLPFVFERFRQADASLTRSRGGLGLGLAIVRHLVELHGGTIRAESEGRGRGATFTVTLPLMTEAAHTPPAEHEGGAAARRDELPEDCSPSLDGLRVLVVDDERDTLEYLRAMLERCGAQVTAVSSADEALRAVKGDGLQVMISDIGMPGEDGYVLMRKVRRLGKERGGRIPAVALTAYVREGDRRTALAAGFQAHLTKPVEPSELIRTVASIARRAEA